MHESEKWKWSRSVVSDSSQPHGLQPTRLLHPWDFPSKSTGVGCHCLLRYMYICIYKYIHIYLVYLYIYIRWKYMDKYRNVIVQFLVVLIISFPCANIYIFPMDVYNWNDDNKSTDKISFFVLFLLSCLVVFFFFFNAHSPEKTKLRPEQGCMNVFIKMASLFI